MKAEQVKQRGKNVGIGSDRALARYAQEGILRRMAAEFGDEFVLKGALLLLVEYGNEGRPTMDADVHFHRRIDNALARVRDALSRDIGDGLTFELGDAIEAQHNEEPGFGIPLKAWIGTTRIDSKIDVGFGGRRPDAVVAKTFPSLMKGAEPFTIPCMPWAHVAAEKIHAIQVHGDRNTRMKDYYDILTVKDRLDPAAVARAIAHTWEDRRTALPEGQLPGLTVEYADAMQRNWSTFAKRLHLEGRVPAEFAEVTFAIRPWVEDVIDRARALRAEAVNARSM